MPDTGWRRPFDEPIPLPRGRQLIALQDAGTFITKLPKAEYEASEWQATMEALILVATLGGPTMFARIGVMRALNAGNPDPKFGPPRKRAQGLQDCAMNLFSSVSSNTVLSINGRPIKIGKQPALRLGQMQGDGSRLTAGAQKLPDIVHMSARLVLQWKLL
jgi:hypothetical protein